MAEFEKLNIARDFGSSATKTTEWQEYAVRLCQELKVPAAFRGRVFRAVKYYPRGRIEAAKSFCDDYTGQTPRHMLFFWKLNQH